jgi:hypothetical protein
MTVTTSKYSTTVYIAQKQPDPEVGAVPPAASPQTVGTTYQEQLVGTTYQEHQSQGTSPHLLNSSTVMEGVVPMLLPQPIGLR